MYLLRTKGFTGNIFTSFNNFNTRLIWSLTIVISSTIQLTTEGTVVPPPWADPNQNPCAAQPGGWQLLYWPQDQKCYKIFQKGYPCPDSMELTPGVDRIAECRCPPGTAQSPRDALCHSLYQRGPCNENEYFAPVMDNSPTKSSQKQRWGVCLQIEKCINENEVFWPNDGRCYKPYTRGPCAEGQLLSPMNNKDNLADCQCERSSRMAKYYWESGGTCHEPFTAGPCQERGMLFLPGGKCGCHSGLQQFHPDTAMCYQLGTVGPCLPGHQFVISSTRSNNTSVLGEPIYARCKCKEGHIRWTGDGICYRPYTRGPCQPGFMYSVNKTEDGNKNLVVGCVTVPCPTGRLYFPGRGCHRVGTQGPCPPGQVVLFQESVKTSVEGISYKGMCGCPSITSNANTDTDSFYPQYRATEGSISGRCPVQGRREDNNSLFLPELDETACTRRGTILWNDDSCVQLYTQGPCSEGEWVVPDRGKGQRKGRGWKMGKCECRPGFTVIITQDIDSENNNKTICQPPVVSIARFLNNNNNNSNNKDQTLDDTLENTGVIDNYNN